MIVVTDSIGVARDKDGPARLAGALARDHLAREAIDDRGVAWPFKSEPSNANSSRTRDGLPRRFGQSTKTGLGGQVAEAVPSGESHASDLTQALFGGRPHDPVHRQTIALLEASDGTPCCRSEMPSTARRSPIALLRVRCTQLMNSRLSRLMPGEGPAPVSRSSRCSIRANSRSFAAKGPDSRCPHVRSWSRSS